MPSVFGIARQPHPISTMISTMRKKNILSVIRWLTPILFLAFLICYFYQPWQILMRGFPIFRHLLDVEKWRMNEEDLAAGRLDYTAKLQVTRQGMVSDLICHHKDLYVKREVLLATLGKSITFDSQSGRTSLALLDCKNDSVVLSRINSRSGKIEDISGFCITKNDVLYVAGVTASGYCLLIFFYDDTGTIIDCAWMEEQ